MAATRKKPALHSSPRHRLDEWSPTLLKSRLYGQLLVDIIIGRLGPGERLDELRADAVRIWRRAGWYS